MQFLISVDGRPVAELGPHRPRRWVGRDRLLELMSEAAVPELLDDVRRLEGGEDQDLEPLADVVDVRRRAG